MAERFIQMVRSDTTRELFKRHHEFVLLAQIAYRAKRTNGFSSHGLEIGEALIGDHESCGLTRQQYRTALKNLKKWGFITTKPTNKGTIAKIVNSKVFDINQDESNHQTNQRPTISQPTTNHQVTTINKEKNLKRRKQEYKIDEGSPTGPANGGFFQKNDSGHFSNMVGEWFASINESCRQIQSLSMKTGKRFNPYQWVQQKISKRGHPGAIDASLKGIVKMWADIEKPWAYIDRIFKTVNGNWNERDAVKAHEVLKALPPADLSKIMGSITLLKEI